MDKVPLNPKFSMSRIDDVVVLTMNAQMASSILEVLDDFEQLETHEYAMREQLRKLCTGAMAQQRRRLGAYQEDHAR